MTDVQTSAVSKKVYDPFVTLKEYEYEKEAGPIRRFLWFCAGADRQLLLQCPQSDRVKEEGIGGTVLATAVLAFLSGSYAMYTVFVPKTGLALSAEQQAIHLPTLFIAIVVGFIWSLVIFNLDRFVVSSTGHGDGTDKITGGEMVRAVPRVIMAAIIGFTLSKPLEIQIMKTEIEAELRKQQTEYFHDRFKDAESRYAEKRTGAEKELEESKGKIQKGEDELDKIKQDIRAQMAIVEKEASGESGSGRAGRGPAYRDKKENLEKKEADRLEAVESFKQERLKLESDIVKSKSDLEQAEKEREQERVGAKSQAQSLDGLVRRIEIGHEISPVATWCLTILLLLIEVTPIFFKMMLTKGPYDHLVENQKEMLKAKWAIQEVVTQDPENPKKTQTHERFHRAETVRDYELGQLEVERTLTKVAHGAFQSAHEQKIKQDPERYVQESDSVPRG